MWTNNVAQATAVAGYDLLQSQEWRQRPYRRVLKSIAYSGSAAVGDCSVELFIDSRKVGKFFNTRLAMFNRDDIIQAGNLFIPAGSVLRAIAVTQPTTNQVFLGVEDAQI